MTDPFFLETLVASDLLPFERPFVVAHEWAHLAGFTDEGEANFVGWLTCLRGATAAALQRLAVSVRRARPQRARADRVAVAAALAAGPREDLRAIAAASSAREPARRDGRLAGLRSVSEGQPRRARHGELRARSSRLVLGVTLDASWTQPLMR